MIQKGKRRKNLLQNQKFFINKNKNVFEREKNTDFVIVTFDLLENKLHFQFLSNQCRLPNVQDCLTLAIKQQMNQRNNKGNKSVLSNTTKR